jgi:putative tryptophan/tyrosine transport system substrate-binding protein
MRRRDLIAVLGGAAAASPFAVPAQQKTIPVIGYLSSNSPEIPVGEVAAFKAGLSDAGFAEGRGVTIDYRFAEGDYGRLPGFAAELVTRHVNVIAASGLPAALAAKRATSTIPVVFTIGVDPIVHGLAASLRQPGGNLTGVTQMFTALGEKQLQILHELVPSAMLVGFLANPKNPNFAAISEPLNASALRLGLQVVPLSAATKEEIEPAFVIGRENGIGALLIGGDNFLRTESPQLVRLAAHHAFPTMYDWRESALDGGLISYGTRAAEMRRQAGVYVGRILQGAKPGELPVIQPTRFELVINLKTANTLGLTVPQSLLARADEVVE